MSDSRLGRRLVAGVVGLPLAIVAVSGALAGSASAATAHHAAPAAGSSADAPDTSWFVDPLTPAQRAAAVAVPKNVKAYGKKVDGKKLTYTAAAYRTASGALAVPMSTALGHTVSEGQALTLDGGGLFVIDTTKLTGAAKSQLQGVAAAFQNAAGIRCEGNADYGSSKVHGRELADGRAAAVCDYLGSLLPEAKTSARGYGINLPAVVGGKAADRALNRRVVVQMTAAVEPTDPDPTEPPVVPPVVPPITVPPIVVPDPGTNNPGDPDTSGGGHLLHGPTILDHWIGGHTVMLAVSTWRGFGGAMEVDVDGDDPVVVTDVCPPFTPPVVDGLTGDCLVELDESTYGIVLVDQQPGEHVYLARFGFGAVASADGNLYGLRVLDAPRVTGFAYQGGIGSLQVAAPSTHSARVEVGGYRVVVDGDVLHPITVPGTGVDGAIEVGAFDPTGHTFQVSAWYEHEGHLQSEPDWTAMSEPFTTYPPPGAPITLPSLQIGPEEFYARFVRPGDDTGGYAYEASIDEMTWVPIHDLATPGMITTGSFESPAIGAACAEAMQRAADVRYWVRVVSDHGTTVSTASATLDCGLA